jgi:hypothetical protein
MKLFYVLALSAVALLGAVNSQLKQVNTIYILGMGNGMDQYLANQLTALGVLQVVTDPQKADAVITDRLGEPFETKLKELYSRDSSPAAGGSDKNSADSNGAGRVSAVGRGRGNFFIVDRKNRTVLWSIHEESKDSTPGELTKTAHKIVLRLKNDLTDKKQTAE